MNKIDKRIRDLWVKHKTSESDKRRENCPEDKLLASYVDGLLKGPDNEQIERHLSECNDCLELILLHKKVCDDEIHETVLDAPQEWIERAVNLHPLKEKDATESLFDIVLKFAKETIEVIKNPGNLPISYETCPVPVRGEKEKLSTNIVTLGKTFSNIKTEIEIEKVDEGFVNIRVAVKSIKSDLPLKGLRISLLNPSQEVASCMIEDGEVCFEDIRLGEYFVNLNRLGDSIGQISLSLKG